MTHAVARWSVALVMLAVLCSAVAMITTMVVASVAGVRDDATQGMLFSATFLIAVVAGFVWLPLGRRP